LFVDVAALVPPRRRPRAALLVAALAVVAVAGVSAWLMWGPTSVAPERRVLTRITFDTSVAASPAISPDGKLIVYTSDRATPRPNLWIQQVSGGQAVQLTRHEGGATSPSFSPDGTRIVYAGVGQNLGIYIIPTIGGDPKQIATGRILPRYSPDGTQIAYHEQGNGSGPQIVIPADGGRA
jgi:Tol biopolymer transport system component